MPYKDNPIIYQIINLINEKVYIGSTISMGARQNDHFKKLRKNIHPNNKLQFAFNKYKEENFKFQVIEYINTNSFKSRGDLRKQLCFIEQHYIDITPKDKLYNLCMSTICVAEPNHMIGGKHPLHKKISVFDLNMNFIEEIAGMNETCRKYNAHNILQCCRGKKHNINGFIFRFSDDLNVKYDEKPTRVYEKGKEIYCYDFDGNFIGLYYVYRQASKATGVCRKVIQNDLNGIINNRQHLRKNKVVFSLFNLIKTK